MYILIKWRSAVFRSQYSYSSLLLSVVSRRNFHVLNRADMIWKFEKVFWYGLGFRTFAYVTFYKARKSESHWEVNVTTKKDYRTVLPTSKLSTFTDWFHTHEWLMDWHLVITMPAVGMWMEVTFCWLCSNNQVRNSEWKVALSQKWI